MSEICTCAGTAYGNTGVDNCEVVGKVPHNIIIMPKYGATGAENVIDLTSVTIGQDIKDLCLASTAHTSRMFPLPFAENFQITKSETVYETGPSGNKYKIKDGIRSFAFDLVDKNGSVRMLSQLKQFGCSDLVYFVVDIEGKIEGWKSGQNSTDLHGFPMSNSTWNAILTYATDTTVQKVMVSFDQSQYFNDGSIYYLTPTDLGYSATELKGLLSANMVTSAITTTGVTVTVKKANSIAVGTGSPIVGLLLANFTLVNQTTGLPVTITAVNETANGVYALTYAAVTGTHTFKLSATAIGYDIPTVSYVDPA
jgi:hypothetical protein